MFQGPYPVILEVFRMLSIHWRGFSNGGIYILFLCSFQQFYRFFLFPTFNTCNFLPFNNFSKLKSFFFSSKFDEGSFHAQHLFSQLRIISIPWCMAKGAVISEWNPEILKLKIFIYHIIFRTIIIYPKRRGSFSLSLRSSSCVQMSAPAPCQAPPIAPPARTSKTYKKEQCHAFFSEINFVICNLKSPIGTTFLGIWVLWL